MNGYEKMRGVDPRVLEFLQKKRERAEAPNHALMAAMAQASAAAGTIGGQQADTSGLEKFAQTADARNQKFQQAGDDRQAKLGNYLAQVSQKNQARDLKLADLKEQRGYTEGLAQQGRDRAAKALTEQRSFDAGLAAKKRKQGLEDQAAEDKQDIKMQTLKDKGSLEREQIKADKKGKKKGYSYGGINLGGIDSKQDNLFGEMLNASGIRPVEQKGMKQVAYRYQIMRANMNKLKELIDKKGTVELTGPHSTRISGLVADIALDHAKLVDPESVAREGEVIVSKKYQLPIEKWGGWGYTNDTAIQLVDDQLKKLDARLNAKLDSYGLGNVQVVKALADKADELYPVDMFGEKSSDTAIASPKKKLGIYKEGEHRTIDGVKVTRQADGTWSD